MVGMLAKYIIPVLLSLSISAQVWSAPSEFNIQASYFDQYFALTQHYYTDVRDQTFDDTYFRREIDAMKTSLAEKIQDESDRQRIIAAFREVVFGEAGFSVDRSSLFEQTVENLMMRDVIAQKRGTCLSLSMVYLILAEELGVPMHGVLVPGHFFVRYGDGEKVINIELTQLGQIQSDQYYRDRFLKDYASQVYLRTLTKEEVGAVLLSNFSTHFKLSGRFDTAQAQLDQALTIIPDFAPFLTNRGNLFERQGEIFKALSEYQKALAGEPQFCEAHYNTALAHYLYTKQWELAVKHGVISAQRGCRMHPQFQAFLTNEVRRGN